MRSDANANALGSEPPGTGLHAANVSIVLVAGVRLYREGLASNLRSHRGYDLVGATADGSEAIAAVAQTGPDVVLLDIGLPCVRELIHALKSTHGAVRIVAYAVDECEREIEACAKAGFAAFVTTDVTVDGLIAAIDAVMRDELHCTPRAAALMFKRVAELSMQTSSTPEESRVMASLTTRECEIAEFIASGCSNKQIGRNLNIAVSTVKNHTHHILEKLHVSTRAEAAVRVRGAMRPG